jgi:hypothetical protein
VAFAAALAAGLLLAWLATRTPPPAPVDHPARAFSAMRAMEDVEAIARRPRPVGSAEHARVRDYLVARLRGMRLATQVRRYPSAPFKARRLPAGVPIDNIVATLPGRDRRAPALVVMSHYDSVPGSPGAADDAAGVAASLEIARALQARGVPARDVIFLVTDAEEACLCGARAFFAGPDARRVGAVLNLEARGGGGRAIQFETGTGSGGLVRTYAGAARNPTSNSLAAFVYEQMPNDTDFSAAKARGLQGLNFAFIGRPAQYHDASSTPAALDKGSLQHIGEQALAAAGELAFAERLPAPAVAPVYSDVMGAFLLHYPAWAGWAVLGVAFALAAWAVLRARRAGLLPLPDLLQGLAAGAYLVTVGFLVLRVVGRLAGLADPGALLRNFMAYEAALLVVCLAVGVLVLRSLSRERRRTAMAALAIVLAGAGGAAGPLWLAALGVLAAALALAAYWRPAAPWSAWTGLLLIGFVLAALLQQFAPAAAFVVAWPLLAAAASAALLSFRPQLLGRPAGLATPAVFAALALGQVLSWGHGVALGVGSFAPEPLILFTFVAMLVCAPLLLAPARRLV